VGARTRSSFSVRSCFSISLMSSAESRTCSNVNEQQHSRADRLTTTPAPAVAQCKRASTVVELASSNGSHTGLLAITTRTSSEGGVNGGVNGGVKRGVKGGVKGGREDSPVR
jgi:hypothetical protein